MQAAAMSVAKGASDTEKETVELASHQNAASGPLTDELLLKRVGCSEKEGVARIRLDREMLNDISLLPERFGSGITHLYLQHNELDNVEPLLRMRDLKFAALSHNRISSLTGLEFMNSLLFLDLSHNAIVSLDELVHHLPVSLKFLCIAGNPGIAQQEATARAAVLALLPNIKWIDSEDVTAAERRRAQEQMGVSSPTDYNDENPSKEAFHVTDSVTAHRQASSVESARECNRKADDDKQVLQSLLPSLLEQGRVRIPEDGKQKLTTESLSSIQQMGQRAFERSQQRLNITQRKSAEQGDQISDLRNHEPLRAVIQLSKETGVQDGVAE